MSGLQLPHGSVGGCCVDVQVVGGGGSAGAGQRPQCTPPPHPPSVSNGLALIWCRVVSGEGEGGQPGCMRSPPGPPLFPIPHDSPMIPHYSHISSHYAPITPHYSPIIPHYSP